MGGWATSLVVHLVESEMMPLLLTRKSVVAVAGDAVAAAEVAIVAVAVVAVAYITPIAVVAATADP